MFNKSAQKSDVRDVEMLLWAVADEIAREHQEHAESGGPPEEVMLQMEEALYMLLLRKMLLTQKLT